MAFLFNFNLNIGCFSNFGMNSWFTPSFACSNPFLMPSFNLFMPMTPNPFSFGSFMPLPTFSSPIFNTVPIFPMASPIYNNLPDYSNLFASTNAQSNQVFSSNTNFLPKFDNVFDMSLGNINPVTYGNMDVFTSSIALSKNKSSPNVSSQKSSKSTTKPSDVNSKNLKNSNDKDSEIKRGADSLKNKLVQKALSYENSVNDSTKGRQLFSGGKTNQRWCADFVTYNLKAVYGSKLPQNFGQCTRKGKRLGSSAVSGIKGWAEDNNCYYDTRSKSAGERAAWIAKNIKPGDIMIEKDNNKSHTGIVTKVNSDGSFETVEGNTSQGVATRRYNADSKTLSGFVILDKFIT